LDAYFRGLLDLDAFSSIDASMNGIQVDNDGADVQKIAFAVDGCLETFKRAADAGAGLLFVHHGLYWGSPLRIEACFRTRLKFLLDNNIALYAVHLPLDQHPELGNNAALAALVGLDDKEPFGLYHGKKIGFKGKLREALTTDEAVKRISFNGSQPLSVLPFGPSKNSSCAIISGGAAGEALQAVEEGIDLYITGESGHTIYHPALEAGLNMIAGGHYATEVWGVQKIMERCKHDLKISGEFIDVPTGL
jgi:dinuclear metal center YbgI/SA1388 family protein